MRGVVGGTPPAPRAGCAAGRAAARTAAEARAGTGKAGASLTSRGIPRAARGGMATLAGMDTPTTEQPRKLDEHPADDGLREAAPAVRIDDAAAELAADFAAVETLKHEAVAAVAALLLHPSAPRATYERTRDAAVALLRALEVEMVCRDCLGGRCHFSGAAARESEAAAARGEVYEHPAAGVCGCRFHAASVESRQRRAALRELGLIPQD